MNLDEMKALYKKANKAYNNGLPSGLTDAQFDNLEKKIRKLDPQWKELRKTGAPVINKKTEVELEEFMPSLSKAYPETIGKWLAKQKAKLLLFMHKLDGSSLQVKYINGKPTKVVTRGDGTLGGDISFLIPHLNLPKLVSTGTNITLRCEAVMKTKTFEKKWSKAAKGEKDGFDNARNMVAGLLNRMKPHPGLKDIDIVVLGMYHEEILKGLTWCRDQGLQVVEHALTSVDGNFEELLSVQRKRSEYEIDGLVLIAPRQVFEYENAQRPKFSIAFKVNGDEDAAETVVDEVIWQHSRTGRLTPKIKVKPVKMKGVTVTYATAHNAKWMQERGIGVGAVVRLVRSGDVIPKIVGVVKKAKKPAVPDCKYVQEGVHFMSAERHQDSDVREIHHFFATLGIEHIAQKTVAKLYTAGFPDVLAYLISYEQRMTGFAEAGMGKAMTQKIYVEFSRVLIDEGVTLLKLMDASNCFESFGERKLEMIEQHFLGKGDSDPLKGFVKLSFENLQNERNWGAVEMIKGMGPASARQFFEGVQRFKLWFAPILKLKLLKINPPKVIKKKKPTNGKLNGERVSFTGYRNPDHEAAVEILGAEVVKYGAKTTILLYKKGGKASTKVEAARAKGIRVCTIEEI